MQTKMDQARTKTMGLAALLHDVGKTTVSQEVLTAPRKLTDDEFAQMRAHTTRGYNFLKKTGFNDPVITLTALQHHEKLDGSGYPKGVDSISYGGRLVGIIDCYEAITTDSRPYRDAMDPFAALSMIKGDVESGKLDSKLFGLFVTTLSSGKPAQ